LKKLCAVSLFFTLLASALSAESYISGSVGAAATIIKGTNVTGDDLRAGSFLGGSIELGGEDDNGLFGGTVSVDVTTVAVDPNALAWWRPIAQVRLQIGFIDDFAASDIVGWGFHGNDAEDYVVSSEYYYAGGDLSQTTGFYEGTGWGFTGLALTLKPFYGLDVNIAFPYKLGNPFTNFAGDYVLPKASDVYLFGHFQVTYTVWNLGRFAVSYKSGGDGKLKLLDPDIDDLTNVTNQYGDYLLFTNASTIYASFLMTAFENFAVNAGFSFTLPVKGQDPNSRREIVYYQPMGAGLAFLLGSELSGIKVRFAARFAERALASGFDVQKEPFRIGLGVLPYYNMGIITFYFNAGASYKGEDVITDPNTGKVSKIERSSAIGWYVNPYITIRAAGATFFAGLQVESDGLLHLNAVNREFNQYGSQIIDWGIPIGIQYSF